jgi:hypothetical protein
MGDFNRKTHNEYVIHRPNSTSSYCCFIWREQSEDCLVRGTGSRTKGRESENRKGLKLFQDLRGQHIADTFFPNPLYSP